MNTFFNDLARLLPDLPLVVDLPQAIRTAEANSTVMILDRVCSNAVFDSSLVAECRRKKLKVYCEMPFAPQFKRQRLADAMRLVSMDDSCGLPQGTIIAVHRIEYIPTAISPGKVLLAAAKVAGYRKLAFPMPEEYTPVVFEHPEYKDFIISLLPLSNFVCNRCTPTDDFRKFFEKLLERMNIHTTVPPVEPTVRAIHKPDDVLDDNALDKCVKNAFDFLEKSILYRQNNTLYVAEGFASTITRQGAQPWRSMERSDCTFETAGALAVAGRLSEDSRLGELAEELFTRIADDPANRATNPHDPCYGQFTFYENVPTYYASGNAKSAMLMMAALPLTGNRLEREKIIMRLMYSLLRSTGINGHHRSALTVPDSFREHNWDFYAAEDYVNNTPHREAALLAMFACAYYWTKDEDFKLKAERGIASIMRAYPDLPWTNGYSAELAKLPLVLALMLQIDPGNEQYKQWLDQVVSDIAARMDEHGALLETFHIMDNGLYAPPKSHSEYGSAEAPLIDRNGDPCCDFVYTQVFALAGMHEAYMCTKDERCKKLRDRLTEFMIRTQIVSFAHPEFNGGWMRAFDTNLWEYYGSSSDPFWGAWCLESGWTNAPAAMNLLMIQKNRSLFSLMPPESSGAELFAEIRASMQEVHPLEAALPDAAKAIIGNEDIS